MQLEKERNLCKVVYVRGISKIVTLDDIRTHFAACGNISKITFSESPRQGFCWVAYESAESAQAAVLSLHHSKLGNVTISVRFEFGRMADGSFTAQPSPVLRRSIDSNANASVTYTSRGLMVNNSCYPIPTGQYLLQLLQLRHNNANPTLLQYFDILLNQPNSSKQNKELTEVMAMVNALKTLLHRGSVNFTSAAEYTVYVLADGQTPLTAAAIALYFPSLRFIYSIDPLLSSYSSRLDRITCVPKLSQEFQVPATSTISIVIACHSHAPLQEFWDRVSTPKVAVTMPCCSTAYSALDVSPVDVYDDFEVYSPKRKVYLYEALK